MVRLVLILAFVGCARAAPTGGVLDGICEASSVVRWEDGWLVADNEASDRLFRFDQALRPVGVVPLASSIDDVEGLAPSPAGLWIAGSQSTNKNAEARPQRERLALLGRPAVVPDLSACAACVAARGRAPNAGGLNVEGAAWHGDRLWLGLRAPLADGKALLLETAAAPDAVRVTRVVPVDLGGAGVRELSAWQGGLLVVSGPVDDTQAGHAVWWLSTPEAPPKRLLADLPPRTEGLAVNDAGVGIVVIDGDGKPGKTCKEPARWAPVTLPAR